METEKVLFQRKLVKCLSLKPKLGQKWQKKTRLRRKLRKSKSKFSFWDKKVEFQRGIAEEKKFFKPKLGQKWQKQNCENYKK